MDIRPKVLSIDNNSANQRLLSAILGVDYQLVTAMSGGQGLRMLHEVAPDIILLDIDMPGIDGIQTCRTIRTNPQYIYTPIIFVSCLTSREDQLRAFNSGGDDFIAKPFDIEILQAKINVHLQRGRRSNAKVDLAMDATLDEQVLVFSRQTSHYLLELMKINSLTHLCEMTLDTLNKIGLKGAIRIHQRPELTCSSCGPLTDLEASLLSDAFISEPLLMSGRFVLGSAQGALMVQNMPLSGSRLYGYLQEALLIVFEAFGLKVQALLIKFSAVLKPENDSVHNAGRDLKQLSGQVEKVLRNVEKHCDQELNEILLQLNVMQNEPTRSSIDRTQLTMVHTRLRQVKAALVAQCMELEGRCLQFLAGQAVSLY